MAISEVDICNAALDEVGGTSITSLTQGTKNANVCNRLYAKRRDALLRTSNWTFATKLVKLAQLSTDPIHGYDNAFALPSDWIRTNHFWDNDAQAGGGSPYQQVEIADTKALASSVVDAFISYVYRQTDPNMFTEDFRLALEFMLARDMAIPIAKSRSLRAVLKVEFEDALRAAKSSDGLGSPLEQRPRGTWAESRNSWPSSAWPR